MPRKRPKSLDAPVVQQAIRLEAWVYRRADEWKRSYRYTLINDYRTHITEAKDEIISAFELPTRYRGEKVHHYSLAQVALAKAEANMDVMIMAEFNIMSEKDWAAAAVQIDDIRIGIARLANSLTKGVGGSELPICGEGGATADYKDV